MRAGVVCANLWSFTVIALLACSTGSKEPRTTGAGGSAGVGGMGGASGSLGGTSPGGAGGLSGASGSIGGTFPGGAGGSAGGTSPGGAGGREGGSAGSTGVTAGIACYRYVEAQSNRRAECRGTIDAMGADYASSCPSAFLIAGSTRTIDSLLACARVWTTFDCDRVLRGEVPDCVTPGTLGPGEPCSFGSQCTSLVCLGTCTTPAPSGGACSEKVTCPLGQKCANSACIRNELPGLEADDSSPVRGPGETCVWSMNCRNELFCQFVAATPGTGRCASPPAAGSACGDSQGRGASTPNRSACDAASYCGRDEMCHELPPLGAACGEDRFNGTLHCAKGGYCDTATMKCVAALGLGQSCKPDTVFSGRTGLPLTEPCDTTAGGACTCPGGRRVCDGASGVCAIPRNPGETCTREVEMCVHGSTCVAGICDYP